MMEEEGNGINMQETEHFDRLEQHTRATAVMQHKSGKF
jgi:hypothetical protein